MKLLFENWRKYLNEGVDPRIQKQIDNLIQLPNVEIGIRFFKTSTVYFEYVDSNTQERRPGRDITRDEHRGPWGTVSIMKSNPEEDGNCLNGYVVYSTEASHGWGPLLYEIALEWASQNSGGLMPDRGMVSKYASAVWDKYAIRSDVDKKQLDVDHELDGAWMQPYPELTPDIKADDCDQGSSIFAKGSDWPSSNLSKIYYKDTQEAMAALKKAGRLIIK